MAYYFIGTDKELEKAGFTFVLDAEILAIRRRDNGSLLLAITKIFYYLKEKRKK